MHVDDVSTAAVPCHGHHLFHNEGLSFDLPAELGTAAGGTPAAVQSVLGRVLDLVAQAAQVALPALVRPQTASTGAGTGLRATGQSPVSGQQLLIYGRCIALAAHHC
jgi:hypothetical protein